MSDENKTETGIKFTDIPAVVPDHELLRCIGQGSYGEVWLARNVMGSYRAVKLVYRARFKDTRPYEREFNGIKKFEPISRSNEGLIDILQVGRNDEAGYFYYVMELADDAMVEPRVGLSSFDPETYLPKTLSSELRQSGRLPVERCLQLGLSLSLALDYLHQSGLIHRDIKPSNIIFVNGIPKLADIGLVTDLGGAMSFVGTEGYIPPEGPNSRQADIYSLGKVLYEMSMGKDRQEFPEPFTALVESPESEALLELNAVIIKACALDPADRYESADELHLDLALLQSGRSVKRKHQTERRLKLAIRVGVVAAVVALVAIAGYFLQARQTKTVKKLAADNLKLAREAQQSADTSRQRLRQLQVANGTRLLDEGDISGSLPWFAEALKLTQGDPKAEEMDRYRLGTLLRYSPKLVGLFLNDGMPLSARLSADEQRVTGVSMTDKKYISIKTWDVVTGNSLFSIPGTNITGGADSRLGRWILTLHDDSSVRVWDADTRKPVAPPIQIGTNISRSTVSPDGKKVVTVSGSTATIWDVSTAKILGQPLLHSNRVHFVVFSPDGTRIVTGSEGNLGQTRMGAARVWNSTTGEPVTDWFQQENPVRFAKFSPDGRKIITTENNFASYTARASVAKVWDAATGHPLFPPLNHFDAVIHADFSPDGRYIATASGDRTAMIWNARTGETVGHPLKHGESVEKVVFSPDGRWLATAAGSTVRLWDVLRGELVTALLKHNNSVSSVNFSSDGTRLITSSRDHLVRLWNITSGEPTLPIFSGSVFSIARASFSPDGSRVMTTSSIGDVQVWRSDTGMRIPFINPERTDSFEYKSLVATVSADGKRIAVPFGDTTARILNLETGKSTVLHHSDLVYSAIFSPDDRRVVTTCGDFTARIWDAATGEPITPPLQHSKVVRHAIFSPDGLRVLTASDDMTARLWDASTGTPLTPPMQHSWPVYRVAFSPDGRRIVTAGQGDEVTVRDATTGEKILGFSAHAQSIVWVVFSPDGTRIVTASMDNTARVWDSATGHAITPPLRHGGNVHQASFSPDGRRVVTASSDGTARVWDGITGEALSQAFQHRKGVLSASFSPDGQRIVTGSLDGTAQIWELPKTELPLKDIITRAGLLAGGGIGSNGKGSASMAETLERDWHSLRSRYPEAFETTKEEIAAWHRRQLNASERDQQWFAALFHLDRLTALSPDDTSLRKHRADILTYQPPRDPITRPELIDLSDFYNASLLLYWHLGPAGNNLADLPRGVQHVGGVDFDIRGLIQVGKDPELGFGRIPERISKITIARKLKRLHFLHGSCLGPVPDGTKIGSYILHFADGRQKEKPIIYGQDVRDWWSPEKGVSEPPDPRIAWEGTNEAIRNQGRSIRLFTSIWENEWPDIDVVSLDLVAESERSAPFLIALTAE